MVAVGETIQSLYPNQKWGEGVVIEVRTDPQLKPLVVQRADGAVGYFHQKQVIKVVDA